MELFVRESRAAEVLAAEFPNPSPDMADEIRRLLAGDGSQYSALLATWLTTVADGEVHDALQHANDGAAFLDDAVPGWRDRIDVSVLDISGTCTCVLGQLYGTYGEGRYALRLDLQSCIRYGFLGYWETTDEALSAAWREILTATVPA